MKYVLPVASADRLGGIKVGEDFEIETDGTLNIKNMDTMRQQVEELSVSVADGKEEIAEAITEKGVDTESDATFAVMAESIRSIPAGGGWYGVYEYMPIYGAAGFAGIYEENEE